MILYYTIYILRNTILYQNIGKYILSPPGGGVRQPLPAAAGLQTVHVDGLTLQVRPCWTLKLTLPTIRPGARDELQLDGGGVDALPVEELLDLPGHHHVVLHRVLPVAGLRHLQVTTGHNSPGEEEKYFWKNSNFILLTHFPTSLQI